MGEAGRSSARISKEDVRYIQRLRCALKIDDETFDAMKASVGVASTKDLSRAQYLELVRRIKGGSDAAQWKPVHKSAKASGMHRKPAGDREAVISKIEAILADLKLPWSYADGIARKMFCIERLRFCDASQTTKVMQALITFQRRQEA